jgi:D-alanyl-D-alanine carboxypeptidase
MALREHCQAMARSGDLSGSVLLAKQGVPIFRAAYGLRNRAERLPNLPDTRFNVASIGKLFTSLAILRFVTNGRIGLQDKLIAHWPDYPNNAVAEQVTIHQLLTHTSGIGNYWEALARRPTNKVVTLADTLALFVDAPLEATPGRGFAYSNGGYVVLGMLLEKLSGQTYFDHCERTIFAPLGMVNTAFDTLDEPTENLALGYTRNLEHPGHWRSNLFENVYRGGPAGGGYSTVDDLLRFADAMSRNELLPPEMTRLWTKGRFDYAKGRYGYGCSEITINNHRVVGHSGGHAGIAGEVMVFEDLGYTAVVLTNGEVEAYWELERVIKRLLAGDDAAARSYWFTRDLITRTAKRGAEAGRAFYAARQSPLQARESVIDVYAFKALHSGDFGTAMALFRFNVETFAGSPSALWSLAEGARLTGDTPTAIKAYQAYLDRSPGDSDAIRLIAQLQHPSQHKPM